VTTFLDSHDVPDVPGRSWTATTFLTFPDVPGPDVPRTFLDSHDVPDVPTTFLDSHTRRPPPSDVPDRRSWTATHVGPTFLDSHTRGDVSGQPHT
jgi:hypothetical protein